MKKEKKKKKYKREKRRNKEEERKKERRRKNFCDVRNVEMLSRNSPRHNFNDRQPTSQKGEQCFEVPPLAVHYFFPRLVFSPRILRLSKKKMEKNTATNISIPSHFKKARTFDPGQKVGGGWVGLPRSTREKALLYQQPRRSEPIFLFQLRILSFVSLSPLPKQLLRYDRPNDYHCIPLKE